MLVDERREGDGGDRECGGRRDAAAILRRRCHFGRRLGRRWGRQQRGDTRADGDFELTAV